MKKQCLTVFFLCFIMISIALAVGCNAESLEDAEVKPTFAISSVTSAPGRTVEVPIVFTNNSGVCGATVRLSYDSGLTLTAIRSGSAFSSLVFTRPGQFSTLTPVLLWDGVQEDQSTGEIAFLVFRVPDQEGTYHITANCEAGDVIDGNLNDIEVAFIAGSITVGNGSILEPDCILPAALARIEEEAFMGCSFAYIKLSENVTSIGNKAFADCPYLVHIYIPQKTTAIADDAFYGMTGLVIHGTAGSYAEEYASLHGFTFQSE